MEEPKVPREVRLRFSLTEEEYVCAMREYLRRSHTVSWVQIAALILIFAASGAVLARIGHVSFFPLMTIVLGALVGLYGWYLYALQPKRQFRKHPELGQEAGFCFTAEDYARQDEAGAGIYDWNLKKLWRTKQFYYLFFRDRDGFLLLPRRAFEGPEEETDFEELALGSGPEAAFKTYDQARRNGR